MEHTELKYKSGKWNKMKRNTRNAWKIEQPRENDFFKAVSSKQSIFICFKFHVAPTAQKHFFNCQLNKKYLNFS